MRSFSSLLKYVPDVLSAVTGHCVTAANTEDADSFQQYELRTRKIRKQSTNALSQSQTHDLSGSKTAKHGAQEKEWETQCCSPTNAENPEPGGHSQESVSMLQECYDRTTSGDEFPELMETCMESEHSVINIYSDEEVDSTAKRVDEPREGTHEVEKSTQTDSMMFQSEPPQQRELEMAKHARFLSSVVNLKGILASRKSVLNGNLRDILDTEFGEAGGRESNVPRETIGYVFRSSDTENVFCDTVAVLLKYLEDALRENLSKMVHFWENSICEMVVKMLNEATDSEVRVRKMVATFLFSIIESILKNEEKLKNLVLESKAMFVVSFCQSTYLSYVAINCIIEKLEIIKTISLTTEQTSLSERLSLTHLAKNSYFLLRMLESLLKSFKAKLPDGKIQEIVVDKPEVKNFNVLEMWKRHWHREKVPEERGKGHRWETTVSRWCEDLDGISLHCLSHVPVLLMAVERCGELSKEILMNHHPVATEDEQKVTSAAEKSDVDAEVEMEL